MNEIYVTGTDTGVGKTVLSLLLMQFYLIQGWRPFYLKPLQTGCATAHDEESDARFIYKYVESLRDKDPSESVVYCFRNPKAPYLAARNEGREIDMRVVDKVVEEKSFHYSPLILEAAGGLLVPVAEKKLMVDTIGHNARVLIAARAGLGTINHTLLSIEALKKRGINPEAVVFLDAAETPPVMVAENMEAIETYSGVKVSGVIGRIDDFSRPPRVCYKPLEFLLQAGTA
jgi:dethiobiotin synthetase